ncbi:hypothetical protein F5H01DRAFT_74752 [Linnemannia elongata]|nr:hypothetical protein F5H01DRAFT_74752 [Linnemannia elongata]
MALEETLNLDCMAADRSSNYLYGLASADITRASPVNYADSFVVLIRSNFNPTSLTNITWSVISHTVGTKLSYSYPTFTSVDCVVADDGSFKLLSDVLTGYSPMQPQFQWGFSTLRGLTNGRIFMELECMVGPRMPSFTSLSMTTKDPFRS